VLVEVFLEGCRRSSGWGLAGRQLAEALDVDGDGGQDVLQVGNVAIRPPAVTGNASISAARAL
jgi:hypothetical protein